MVNLIEIVRFVSYFLAGVIPTIALLLGVFLGQDLVVSTIISICLIFVSSFLAFKFTTNPLTQIVSGQSFGVITFDSKGLLKIYSAFVKGNEFVAEIEGEKVVTKFNRKLQWYLKQGIGKGILTAENAEDNKKRIVFETKVDDESLSASIFKTEYPFLLYSTELKTFISKEWLHTQEKDSMLFSQGWELSKDIKEFNRNAGGITRYILDMINKKTGMGGDVGNIIVIIVIIIFVLGLASVFVPDILEAFNSPDAAADGLIADKLE